MCLLDGQRQAMRPCSQSVTVGGEQRQSPRERQRGTERQTDRHTEGDRDTDTWREKGHRGRDAHKEGGGGETLAPAGIPLIHTTSWKGCLPVYNEETGVQGDSGAAGFAQPV